MARGRSTADLTTLQMALVGYQYEKQKIEDRIREIQAQLKGKHVASPSAAGEKKSSGVKRVLSPAARKRIAAAQKKRWAEHRKRIAATAKAE
jgi:cell division septum initiation protein DivIVA